MHRKFIALILAAAVAVTSLSATAAEAGDKDLKRFILGVAALGIAAAAIENQRRGDDGRHGGHVSRQDVYHPPVVHAPQRGHGGYNGGYVAPRPLPDRARAAVLPSECLLQVSDRRGTRNVYGARCLERSDIRVSRLPEHCALTVIGQQGRARTVYDAGCLSNSGYRTARR